MAGSLYGGIHFELGVRNLDALAVNFHKADDTIQEAARAAAIDAAEQTISLAFLLCPKDTEFMANHIKAWFTPSGLGFEVGWSAVDFFDAGLAFYPYFQEFGTRNMAAQPSLGPAWDNIQPVYKETLSTLIRQSIERLNNS